MEGSTCRAQAALSFDQALGVCATVSLAGGLWLYAVGQRLAPGAARLAAALPLIVTNALVPLALFCRWEECTTILLVSFNSSWIGSFKALSWAVDRGALCMQPGGFPLSQFLAIYASPITPAVTAAAAAAGGRVSRTPILPRRGSQGRLGEDVGGPVSLAAIWFGKNVLVLFMVYLLQLELPGLAESFVYGLSLYALLSLIMDGPAALLIGLTGLRVSPHFDRPWRSISVATFWSKRWDLAAGNTLRQLIFDCVVDGTLLPPPPDKQQKAVSRMRQMLGMTATFAASGLIHEGIIWYITGRTTNGLWFAFFLVQAPMIVGERLAMAALKRRGVLLPDWMRITVTYLLVLGSGQYLFWLPAKRFGITNCIVYNTRQTAVAMPTHLNLHLFR